MAITVECTVAQMQAVLVSLGIAATNGDKIIYCADTTVPTDLNQLIVLHASVSDHIFTPRNGTTGLMIPITTLKAAYAGAIEVRALG